MAGILDIFVNYFANPMTWVFMGLFILLGVLLGLLLRPWMGNQVIKFIPAEYRFIDLAIEEETSVSVTCKKQKGMPIQRFYKYDPAFTGIVGRLIKKPISRYLGIEGTAYTWRIKAGKWLKLGTLADAVRTVWGSKFWDSVPDRQKIKLEESRIQVTVGLDEMPMTPEGHRSVSEEDIKQEQDREASRTFWTEHAKTIRGFYINLILAAGTGFGVACLLVLLGILKIQVINVPTAPAPANQTATFINWLFQMI